LEVNGELAEKPAVCSACGRTIAPAASGPRSAPCGRRSYAFITAAVIAALGVGVVPLAFWLHFKDSHRAQGQPSPGTAPNGAESTQEAANSKAELERLAVYLPDNPNLILRVQVDAIRSSKAVQEVFQAVPGMKKQWDREWRLLGDTAALNPSDIASLYLVREFRSEPFRIILFKGPVSRENLLSQLPKEEYREVQVNDFILHEGTAVSEHGTFQEAIAPSSRPRFDGSGAAFCLVEPNLLVSGQARELETILARKRSSLFSEDLREAIRLTDFAQPVIVLGSFKELRDKQGPWQQDPILKVLVDSGAHLAGQLALEEEVAVNLTMVCQDGRAAQEIRKLAEGGLVMLKHDKTTPREAQEVLDCIELKSDGPRLTGSLKISFAQIAKFVARQEQEAEEPAYYGRPLSKMIEDLKNESADRRKSTAGDLGRFGPEAAPAVPALALLLNDPVRDVRVQAVQALGRIGPEARDGLKGLIAATNDTDKDVRKYAIQSLGKIGAQDPGVVPALVRSLRDPDRDVRSNAVNALELIGPEASTAVPALIDLLQETESEPAYGVPQALGAIGPGAQTAVPALVKAALNSPDSDISRRSGEALARIGTEALPALIEALENADAGVRARAAAALGHHGEAAQAAVAALARALSDNDPKVQAAAAIALGNLGLAGREALPQLIQALDRDLPEVVHTLARFGPGAKPAVPGLVRRLPQGAPIDQGWVIDALAAIGPEARAAVPALQARKSAGYNSVKLVRAIWKIDGNADLAVTELVEMAKHLKNYQSEKHDVVRLLGEIGPQAARAVPFLVEILRSQEPLSDSLKEDAYEALGQIGPGAKEAVPVLLEALADTKAFGRTSSRVARALGKIGPEARAAIPQLTRLADRGDYDTRPAAALALAQMGPEARMAVPVLERNARDRHMRIAVAYALWKLDDQVDRPVKVAVAVLRHSEELQDRRLLAVSLVKEMGARAKPAVDALVIAANDRDPVLRQAAVEALNQIDPQALSRVRTR
jgi:HEAT repeat protein